MRLMSRSLGDPFVLLFIPVRAIFRPPILPLPILALRLTVVGISLMLLQFQLAVEVLLANITSAGIHKILSHL
jgi:hypothetical protein